MNILNDIENLPNNTLNAKKYSLQDFKKFSNNSNILILHTNIRSLDKNVDELCIKLRELTLDIDLIILTEAWLRHIPTQMFKLPGYEICATVNNTNQNAGIVIYISERLKSNVQIHEHKMSNCNCLEIKLNDKNDNRILAVYRSPNGSVNEFTSEFNKILNTYKTNQNITVIGDINIDLLEKKGNDLKPESTNYLDMMTENNLIAVINEPTRVTDRTKTLIDHLFVHHKLENKIISTVLKTEITDHYSILAALKLEDNQYQPKTRTDNPQQIQYKYDNIKIKEEIEKQTWVTVINENDLNLATNNFINIIQTTHDRHKETKITEKKYKKLKTWITHGLVCALRKKEKLKQKLKKQPFNIKLIEYYNKYNKILGKLIKKTKYKSIENKVKNCENNVKELWDVIKEVYDNKPKNKQNINAIKNGNEEIADGEKEPDKIADIMGKYFTEIGENMAEKIKELNKDEGIELDTCDINEDLEINVELNKQEKNRDNNEIESNKKTWSECDNITDNEIISTISELRGGSGPGHDFITVKFLKDNAEALSLPIKYLINLSLKSGLVPDSFKIGIITPLLKKGDPKECTNYRPICLISNIAKILEKIVKKRFMNFLENNNKLSTSQYGFRSGRSTQDAINQVTDNITRSLDRQLKPIAVLLDLTKAFDSISHKKIIIKLRKIGINGEMLKWFISYLKDRTYRVKVNGVLGGGFSSQYSIPQGTVLGPLIFITYINDMFRLPLKGNLTGFADDTSLIYASTSWEDTKQLIEHDLTLLKTWLDTNELTLNINKTNFMTFALTENSLPTLQTMNLHSKKCSSADLCDCPKIYRVTEAKYLGITIDQCFTWKPHINNLTKRLKTLKHVFIRLRPFLTIKQLRILYYGLVDSIIRYGILSWGTAVETNKKSIVIQQKSFVRIILGKKRMEHTNPLFKKLAVLPVGKMIKAEFLMTVYKNINSLDPVIHGKNTRIIALQLLAVPYCRTNMAQRQWYYQGIVWFNDLPETIKSYEKYDTYKSRIKSYLISKIKDDQGE